MFLILFTLNYNSLYFITPNLDSFFNVNCSVFIAHEFVTDQLKYQDIWRIKLSGW